MPDAFGYATPEEKQDAFYNPLLALSGPHMRAVYDNLRGQAMRNQGQEALAISDLIRGAQKPEPSMLDKLLGLGGVERFQTWPERMVRSAVNAPQAALNSTPDNPVTTEQMIAPALDIAGMAMGGSMPAAQRGALGSGGGRITQPFYSAVERAAEGAKLSKATPEQWAGYLKNQPGVKPEELNTVLQNLPEGQITKDQLLGHVKENKIELNEIEKKTNAGDLKEAETWARESIAEERPDLHPGTSEYDDVFRVTVQNALDLSEGDLGHGSTTKYQKYQLSGGENYREMLLTLPEKLDWTRSQIERHAKDMAHHSGDNWDALGPETRKNYIKDVEENLRKDAGSYRSSHWDEPNVLLHMRMNDRNIPDVGKSLHLEELQSDWHQAGRKQGYGEGKVPDAPFKSTWADLGLKRAITEAAQKGYDAVSWTPGEAQAARYDLSKQVKGIHWQPSPADKNSSLIQINPIDGSVLKVQVDKSGKIVAGFPNSRTHQWEGKYLADVIGKEHAEKILAKDQGSLEGEGLKIGGEGMKAFYDKMLVDKANALAKKFGAKVEQKTLGDEAVGSAFNSQGNFDVSKMKRPSVHVLRITPELKAAAQKGFPLFSDAGLAGAPLAANKNANQDWQPHEHIPGAYVHQGHILIPVED